MERTSLTTKEYLFPFVLITTLFFLWGIAHGMLDVLNKHFQVILQLSKARSGLIQFAMYMAYFLMALPAGLFMKRYGYRKGIILGLLLFAGGAFLVAGTTSLESFWVFLICLFVLGCGLATLETAANPYTTKLGPPETAERRINLSQSFNGLAWTVGPLIGLYIYGNGGNDGEQLHSLMLPYFVIGLVVFLVAVLFMRTRLPEIQEEVSAEKNSASSDIPLMKRKHFVLGVIAQCAYVAAQTGVFSYLINFITDENQQPHFDKAYGPYFLATGFALFMVGRMSGSYIMSFVKPVKLLALYSAACCMLLFIVSGRFGWLSVVAVYGIFFFMSIMFPTIFSLGIKDLGPKTKKASSFIVMSIVGGAIFPPLMGFIADHSSMSVGFLAPIPLFAFILYYALKGHIVKAAV
ncbi:MAG: sugar MFS transporter [Bacteroidota bacterium]|nr:sugar MFS transporter [Bacteroidota bacterium]